MFSPPRSYRRPDSHWGYTLIELVVVLLVIGVTLSLVIPRLSLPDQRATLNQHARNIQILIHSLEDHSVVLGRIMGLQVKDNALQILQLKQGAWEMSENTSTLRQYTLKSPFAMQLDIGQPLFKSNKEDTQALPAMILPDGQMTPFEIIITNSQTGEAMVLRQDINGLNKVL